MEELRLLVRIDENLGRHCPDAVAFGDFEADPTNVVYGNLPTFFEDLILGRPLPLTFATRGVYQIGTLVAVALFLHRELALEPSALSLVASADLVSRRGAAGLAHIDLDLAKFFSLATAYLPASLVRKEQQDRLATAVGWIREYVQFGRLPSLPREPDSPRVIDVGTNGFVLAEVPATSANMEWAWVSLYRQGFLRGVLLGTGIGDRVQVIAAKKSPFLEFDLAKAAVILNEAECAMGELPLWRSFPECLKGPGEGTLIRPSTLMDVFLRV